MGPPVLHGRLTPEFVLPSMAHASAAHGGIGSRAFAAGPPPGLTPTEEAEKLAHLPPLPPRGDIDRSAQAEEACLLLRAPVQEPEKGRWRFNSNSDVATSKTPPLGTTAELTNPKNGNRRR